MWLLQAIFFKLPITQTPDNSNLFLISLEGSSYWSQLYLFWNSRTIKQGTQWQIHLKYIENTFWTIQWEYFYILYLEMHSN